MHSLVEEKLSHVVELCRRHHVARLDLFGSATGERFDPAQSDLDFVVEYLPDATWGFAGDYFGLKAELEALFGREVDLVDHDAIRNPYFREEVDQTRVPVYAA
jgi:uncharacterized protein